ncbi:MAG: phosphoribosylaminoimidazolesuccinocarboxamide synthase [Planctomycetia bacterium]|nr:phosphoribosylaminoimidazolesuccinocarboxamide synthase [Planctomycetia bacterium]
MAGVPLFQSDIPGYPRRQGKVRDVYDLGDRLVIVASDRLSAFDWVMPTPIPDKGRILTQLSLFWFEYLGVPNHLISTNVKEMPRAFADREDELTGRTMLVKKTQVVPIECVARGYLAGSGWKEYLKSRTVCGIPLPAGLLQASRLPEPLFTPATKAETGHDENISYEVMAQQVGDKLAATLKQKTLDIYQRAAEYSQSKGIILADTKFEFGLLPDEEEPILIDEVLTPDSSRYWPMSSYQTGISPPSFDKQFVRDWLETTSWDKNSPPPALPGDIVRKTRTKYLEAYEVLTGRKWE